MPNLKTKHAMAGLIGVVAMLFLICPVILLARDTLAPKHPVSNSSANSDSPYVATNNAISRVTLSGIGRNERLISSLVAEMMEQNHLSNHAVDDESVVGVA